LVGPFALFVVEKSFLDGSKNLAIGTLNDVVGLWVVHRGKDMLGANGKAEISEVLVVELFAVVDCELGRDSEAADNVLPEEFLSSLRCYYGYCSGLDPHCVIFDGEKVNLRFP
jgi:hypothetical protein